MKKKYYDFNPKQVFLEGYKGGAISKMWDAYYKLKNLEDSVKGAKEIKMQLRKLIIKIRKLEVTK